jgi:hypothetical protein
MILLSSPALATTYFADFLAGIATGVWEVDSNQPLYTVDDSQGDVRLAKPVGGDHSFQRIHIRFRGEVHGDFDVSVDFRDAFVDRVDGQPGNQVQLNVVFGGVEFNVVHSDEINVGRNNHVWIDPPGEWRGEQTTSETLGTLRIARTGVIVSGYVNDNLIHAGIYPTSPPVTFLSFSLQNNGTTDSTSVTFDDFQLTADSLVLETASGIGDAGDVPRPATVRVSPNPFVQNTSIEFELDTPGEVRASIYDATGRPITHLADGYHAEGSYAVPWDGRSASGTGVPSGVYFLRFQFDGKVLTRKLVLIR